MFRKAIVTAGFAAALAVGVFGSAASVSGAACAASVQWHGVTYFASGTKVSVPVGRRLGKGVVPDCQDSPGNPQPDSQVHVAVRAIKGVAARAAILVTSQPGTIWIVSRKLTKG